MQKPQFREKKATEAAAWLLGRHGGRLNFIKLLKLLYLADRTALVDYGRPITFDTYFSLEYGPIPSHTKDLAERTAFVEGGDYWTTHISPRRDDHVDLTDDPGTDHLSEVEIEALREADDEYGEMEPFDLVDRLHHELPEWEAPDGPREREKIDYEDILRAAGWPEDQIEELKADFAGLRAGEEAFRPVAP